MRALAVETTPALIAMVKCLLFDTQAASVQPGAGIDLSSSKRLHVNLVTGRYTFRRLES